MNWTRWAFAAARLLVVAAILTGSAAAASPGQEPLHVRIPDPYPGLAGMLELEGFDVVVSQDDRVELLAHDQDLDRLVELGIDFGIGARDLFPGARSGLREGNLDPEYHTFDEMLAEIRGLEADYPQICKVYDIGDAQSKSYGWDNFDYEFDIWALRISDNPDIDEPEPCVVYDGRHHAREPVSTELVLAVAQYFCQNYGHEPSVTETVDGTEIWIVPMVNPDGHQWVEDNEWWWRKSLTDCNGNHWVDHNEGIDPNRNYDWHWVSGNWESQCYGGPTPWSAPEVASMRDLHEKHRTCLNATVHSFGEMILYPFGYGVDPEPAVIEVAGELGARLGYDVLQSTAAHGTSKDWVYGSLGGCAFTVETATEFVPTGPEMMEIVSELLPGFVWLATRAQGPSIQGTVTDASTGQPLEATIHIPEIQDCYGEGELCDMRTEAATGYFCRLRPKEAETVTLRVSAPGYLSASLKVTTGGRTQPTVVDVELMPRRNDVTASDGLAVRPVVLGPNAPNPFNPQTSLSYTLAEAGHTTIKVYDPAGRMVTKLVDQWLAGGAHVTHWDGRNTAGRQTAPGVYVATLRVGPYEVSWRMVRTR
jgi:hypothetical protein